MRPDYDKAKWVIENLCLGTVGKWSGKPVELLPWQTEVLRAVCEVAPDGERVNDMIWLEVPRKSGKTSLCAYLAICAMLLENNPEVICAAANREQASILFKTVFDQIELSDKLQKLFKPLRKEIRLVGAPGHLKTIPCDGPSVHGLNPSFIVCDELHAWPETKAELLFEALDTARGARNSLMIIITTAGSNFTFAHKLHKRALKIKSGELLDPGFYVQIHKADERDDPGDMESWYKANPSLGVTINESWYRKQYNRAKGDAGLMASFRKLQLNQWSGSSSPWIEITDWREWNKEPDGWEHWDCMLGVDLSSVNDWEAYCLIFYRGKELFVKTLFQIPSESWLQRSEHYGSSTANWVKDGYINVIPGLVHTDHARYHMIEELMGKYNIQHVGFDPYNAHKVAQMLNDNYGEEFCVAIRQGIMFLNEPMKDLYKRGMQGELNHDGSPAMEAHMNAVILMQDKNGNYYIDKSKSTDKIDGAAAMITAHATLIHFEDTSYYENNDLVFV